MIMELLKKVYQKEELKHKIKIINLPLKFSHNQKKKTKEKKKLLTKDIHYYKHNKQLIKIKAKKKYKEKMKNREYRHAYLAKQREYSRRRKFKKCVEIYKLLYPINPFLDIPVQIIYKAV